MIKLLFFIIAIFFAFKIFGSKERYQKLLWVIIGLLLLHNSIIVTEVPLSMPISRWLLFSLIISEFCNFSAFKSEFRRFPLKNTMIVLIFGSLSIALFDNRLNFFYKFYDPFCELTETFFIVFVGYFAIKNDTDIQKLAKPLLILLIFIAFYGLFNWITKQNPYHEIIVNTYTKTGTADFESRIASIEGSTDRYRASSTFNMTFNYGYISSILALFAFAIYNGENKQLKSLSTLGIFAGLIGTVLCFSRTVFISTALAFTISIIFSTTLSKKILSILIIAITCIIMYYSVAVVKESVDNSVDIFVSGGSKLDGSSSFEMRETQLLGAYQYFLQSPIIGNGYNYIDNELGWGDRDNKQLDPDMYGFESIIYLLMIEQGIIGLITKLLLFISLIVFFLKKIKTDKNLSGLGLAIVTLFLSFSIGTGSLGAWPMSMLLLGVIIKTIVVKGRNLSKNNKPSLARI